ncbi:hypothetical protein AAHB37_17175 [Glutamicibacter halophytocola]|uniref:hypothetical protein n=1 Tax=Glutamicibacter halophytocola TaxID=1933880 RepID=UPI00321A584E
MDTISAQRRSQLMSRIRGKNTTPELVLRRLLHAAGYRYRPHGAPPASLEESLRQDYPEIRLRGGKLPGSPDLVFTAKRKAVFVDGPLLALARLPGGTPAPLLQYRVLESQAG